MTPPLISTMIHTANFDCYDELCFYFHGIQIRLVHFDDEILKLKVITTILG